MSRAGSKSKYLPSRVFNGLLYRLKKVGIAIEPFLTVREGLEIAEVTDGDSSFTSGFLTIDDIDDLVRLDRGVERHEMIAWFEEGKLCFGVWHQSRLVARMWCDLDEFSFAPNRRALADNEAYLYAAFSDPDYRGKGLAPLMRKAGYQALREMGRSKFYSYTDYFNTAARRFKEKLGARNEELRLHVGLFGKWSKTLTLRKYR